MNDPANSSDEELADSLSDSNDQALVALAERHAPSLYDFALRLTLDEDAAIEITASAFDQLRMNAGQRPPQVGVRAWLFNFVAEQGLEAGNERPGSTRLSSSDRRFTQAAAGVDREAALWAWQAARSLRPRDYAVVDLTVRRGINPEELTGTATQGRGGVYTILSRASGAFAEAYVATALYFRGRDACGDLAELVGGSGAAMRVGIRRQIASHVEDCARCQTTLESLPNASDIFRDLYEIEPPSELADRILTGMTAAQAIAAGQLTLTDALEDDEADEPGPADEDGFGSADEEPWQETPETAGPPREELLWARPQEAAGIAPSGLPDAVSDLEQRYEVEVSYPSYDEREVREVAGSEYAREPYRSPYAPPPLTLADRLSMWFAPAYGRGFLWSYALLGVATAVAVYLAIAVVDSLRGGGSDGALAVGEDVVREIACEAEPLTLESGSGRVFQFDPAGLDGFQLDSVAVTERPPALSLNALVVEVESPTALSAEARGVYSQTAMDLEYGLQILWQRNGEDAVTDCALFVSVPAATGPAPTSGADTTPPADETPGGEETPEPTP